MSWLYAGIDTLNGTPAVAVVDEQGRPAAGPEERNAGAVLFWLEHAAKSGRLDLCPLAISSRTANARMMGNAFGIGKDT